ncbi:phosphotransferase [Phycicoccus sp. KQZ13P-1]|nr:phosphotransferase [Phycicoccus mangrovi]MBT9256040.1 phosphotransferase [Phycicoccus mangrovi]
MTTARSSMDAAVRQVCGRAVDRLVGLTGGGMNETYLAGLSGGSEVVVRVAKHPVPWFADEPRLMEQARAAGVPAPAPLGVQHVEDETSVLSFCVLDFIPGRSLDTLGAELPTRDLERLTADAGELLARIHTLAPAGGTRHELRPPDDAATARALVTVGREVGDAGVTIVERGVELARRVAHRPLGPLPLAHGDFMPKNLVVDDRRIVGVIDWEFAGPAPPAFDLARWEVSAGDPWHDWSEVLCRGYARVADPTSAAAGLVPAFAVGWALEKLGWRNPAGAVQVRRCLEVIDRYANAGWRGPVGPGVGDAASGVRSPSLEPPRSLERVLDGTRITVGEVRHDHHVRGEAGRDAERRGELRDDLVPVVEVRPEHDVGVVELTSDQPAVVPPVGPAVRPGGPHPREPGRQLVQLRHLHGSHLPSGSAVAP